MGLSALIGTLLYDRTAVNIIGCSRKDHDKHGNIVNIKEVVTAALRVDDDINISSQ